MANIKLSTRAEDKLGDYDPIREAAEILCLMKNDILDKKAAEELRGLIAKSHAKIQEMEKAKDQPQKVKITFKSLSYSMRRPPLPPAYATSSSNKKVVDGIYDLNKAYGHCNILSDELKGYHYMAKRKAPKRKKPEPDNDIIQYRLPVNGYSIDGTRLPRFPELGGSERFLDHDRCSSPFEKQLTASDVDPNQHRLTLSKEFVRQVFLPMLIPGEEEIVAGIPVIVYGQDGREHGMKFKCWSDENVYILTEGWKAFYVLNGLIKLKNWVRVWMFRNRETNGLCFAINVIYMPNTIELVKAKRR